MNAKITEMEIRVINQAVLDLGSVNTEKAVDALFWLTGPDFPLWAEAAGHPDLDAYKMLTTPNLRQYVWSIGEVNIPRMFAGLSVDEAKDLIKCIEQAILSAFDAFQERRQAME